MHKGVQGTGLKDLAFRVFGGLVCGYFTAEVNIR